MADPNRAQARRITTRGCQRAPSRSAYATNSPVSLISAARPPSTDASTWMPRTIRVISSALKICDGSESIAARGGYTVASPDFSASIENASRTVKGPLVSCVS